MTWQEMDRLFIRSAESVPMPAYRRYCAWRLTICDSRLGSPQFSADRWEWAMSDPDWAEAILLARLGGR